MGLFDGMPKEVLAGMLNEQAEKDYSDLWLAFTLLAITSSVSNEPLPTSLVDKRRFIVDGILTHLVVHVEKLREEVITLKAEIIRLRKDMMATGKGDVDVKEL